MRVSCKTGAFSCNFERFSCKNHEFSCNSEIMEQGTKDVTKEMAFGDSQKH